MAPDRKLIFEKVVQIVSKTLFSIVDLFDALGVEGMKKSMEPSIEELESIVSEMRDISVEVEKRILTSEDSIDRSSSLMYMQNIKQGLLFADNLLSSVKANDANECLKFSERIKKNEIVTPVWEE